MDSAVAAPLGPEDPGEIGEYRIIGVLGQGGMGEVYLGTTKDGYVAVKRILPRVVSSERFNREISVLQRVPLGVAPKVLAHSSTAARPWFAAEYVPGVTVEEAVELHGPFPAGVLWSLLAETAGRLREVHAAGIVHRDLKHANVMLTRDGVQLIDFGIARAADQARLTRGGSYGTPGFTAPEQRSGSADVTAAADVYSLGVLIIYAATGEPPGDHPDPGPLHAADAELAALVTACVAGDPGDRPAADVLVAGARRRSAASDSLWPADVMARIDVRREFSVTPVAKIPTVPPADPAPAPAATARTAEPESGRPWLSEAAERLARDVRTQWTLEEELRQVHDPYPLPVRYDTAGPGLFDHWANIRCADPGSEAPAPLPVKGDLDSITRVYASLPSGRLVVLGSPGAGKTILTLRFVLDRLAARSPGDRVPVIFSLGSWNPEAHSLRAWLCLQLTRDHNFLEEAVPRGETPGGENVARALMDGRRILPVLDGFDEIAPGLQGKALERLNRYSGPLLLTSRPGEYAEAVRHQDVLTAAACVELASIEVSDIDAYLTRASPPGKGPGRPTVWEPVLRELRKPPAARDGRARGAANVAEALKTPLMVALARAAYSDVPGHQPAELLDTELFPASEDVQEHLLARFVLSAYPERDALPAESEPGRHWDPERARHWLGFLAWHLEVQGTRDLAWWELGAALGLRVRMRVAGATVAVACAIAAGLLYGIPALVSMPGRALWTTLSYGGLSGIGVGLTFYGLHGLAGITKAGRELFEPSYLRIRLRGGETGYQWSRALPRIARGLAGGLLFGLLWAFACLRFPVDFRGHPMPVILPKPPVALVLGTGLGLTVAVAAVLGEVLEAASDKDHAASPREVLHRNRVNVLFRLVVVGLIVGAEFWAVLGPQTGVLAVLMIMIGAGSLNAWGRWIVLGRVWLPLTGRVPLFLLSFLEDAHHRGVLRQAGSVYQFRHARIQGQLAEVYREHRYRKERRAAR